MNRWLHKTQPAWGCDVGFFQLPVPLLLMGLIGPKCSFFFADVEFVVFGDNTTNTPQVRWFVYCDYGQSLVCFPRVENAKR